VAKLFVGLDYPVCPSVSLIDTQSIQLLSQPFKSFLKLSVVYYRATLCFVCCLLHRSTSACM